MEDGHRMEQAWHTLSAEETARRFGVDLDSGP